MKRVHREPNETMRKMMIGDWVNAFTYRIVVSTLSLSAHLRKLGKGFFTHLFVDEASQACESEMLVALDIVDAADCNVILAGDPFQVRTQVSRHISATVYLLLYQPLIT